MQAGFVTEHTRHIVPIVERLQRFYDRIYATRFINPKGSPYREFLDWHRFGNGSADTALAFRPEPHAVVVEKHVYSCVPGLLEELRQRRTSEVTLCGIDTDACVSVSAIDLFQVRIRPLVLARACASSAGPDYHEAGLKLLARQIGERQILS